MDGTKEAERDDPVSLYSPGGRVRGPFRVWLFRRAMSLECTRWEFQFYRFWQEQRDEQKDDL